MDFVYVYTFTLSRFFYLIYQILLVVTSQSLNPVILIVFIRMYIWVVLWCNLMLKLRLIITMGNLGGPSYWVGPDACSATTASDGMCVLAISDAAVRTYRLVDHPG